jgi:hypothetical protein
MCARISYLDLGLGSHRIPELAPTGAGAMGHKQNTTASTPPRGSYCREVRNLSVLLPCDQTVYRSPYQNVGTFGREQCTNFSHNLKPRTAVHGHLKRDSQVSGHARSRQGAAVHEWSGCQNSTTLLPHLMNYKQTSKYANYQTVRYCSTQTR